VLLKRASAKKPEINIIPMVDVVFQLIIFFLVATQVKKNERQAELQLPTAREAEEIKADETPPLIVNIVKPEVSKVRPYIVMGKSYSLQEFKNFLKLKRAVHKQKNEEMPILRIRADRNSQFKEIQDALIACRDVEIWQVRITALKKKD